MYKLIAIDLDGTLLNSYGTISTKNKETINKVEETGTEIVIASGRPIDSIKTIANEIDSKNYFIAGNGAIVYDMKKDEIIYEKCMSKQKVLEIIKICEDDNFIESITKALKDKETFFIVAIVHVKMHTIRLRRD